MQKTSIKKKKKHTPEVLVESQLPKRHLYWFGTTWLEKVGNTPSVKLRLPTKYMPL